MKASISAIEYYLPGNVLSSAHLAAEFPDWPVEKIESKTGIRERHIAGAHECSSDLGFIAARKLFDSGACNPDVIDYVLFCTQSPDYFLPSTACLLQDRLGIPTSAGALDFNLGCSGFVYGLSLAQGLIETGQSKRVLLITAETYSKFIHPSDKSVRTIFGDAAAATLIEGVEAGGGPDIGPFVFGTDGSGGNNLIVATGGMRSPRSSKTAIAVEAESGNWRSQDNLYMDGPKIFEFTLRVVPECVTELLSRSGKRIDEIDRFIFHQANEFMLDHLRKKLCLAPERFSVALRDCGNTVSASIPIAMKDDRDAGRFLESDLAMLVGFGVGYSWAGTLVRWPRSRDVAS
ncbi:MAG: Beta-ketoacyl-acyl-carrier-protein synthase [Bryobacterales bacterium]|nr:Beta-ketoacyl-acyl-carrier-protein synthase [Bryobacterales bacterium]